MERPNDIAADCLIRNVKITLASREVETYFMFAIAMFALHVQEISKAYKPVATAARVRAYATKL